MALLGSLTGYISHELNNLLTPMKCYAELALRPGSDTKAAHRALELAKEGSDRASRLVQSLLELARNVPGVGPHQNASIRESVECALRFLPRNPSDDGISISLKVSPDLRVAMPRDLLDHLILNLILNARTSMLPKGGVLEIEASADGSTWNQSNMVTLNIRDTGRGFATPPPAGASTSLVFSTKVLDQRTQRTFGLDLCRRLVTYAHGSLEIKSSIGTGTTCTIRIPRAVETMP